ncbi:MAG: c-type cytochrome [Fimbriiglobus sp.]
MSRQLSLVPCYLLLAAVSAGCQQKMATQPAPRPYEVNAMFKHGQSARPLEKGVVHRTQHLDADPLMSWLTPQGRRVHSDVKPDMAASFDPKSIVPPAGVPDKEDYFAKDLPFAPTEGDLLRGQTLYNSNCALCHGAAGYANGKIVERGFLRPPSYHVEYDPATGQLKPDYSTLNKPSTKDDEKTTALPAGYSRGFYRWGHKVPLKTVPIGYIVQVITVGYGGMATHDTQIPDVADRWRVAAYVRALQYSQSAPVADLPADLKVKLEQPTGEGKK